MNWYYEANGQSNGPVAEAEISRLLAAGTITEATLVWSEGMAAWTPLREAFPGGAPAAAPAPGAASSGTAEPPPEGWVRCTATGRYFPPNEIVYIAGKPYSLEAKNTVVQGVIQTGAVPGEFNAERTGPAWERRGELGLVRAAWETTKAALLHPGDTFAGMKREGGLGAPLLLFIVLGTIGGVVGVLYQLLVQMGMERTLQQSGQVTPFGFAMTTTVWLVFALAMPVLLSITAFITCAIVHLCLMITGGAKQPFETTFRTYCYSNGPAALFQVVPICGAYITLFWGLVCMIIGISKTHEITIGRAIVAVLLPILLCCGVSVMAAIALGIGSGLAGAR